MNIFSRILLCIVIVFFCSQYLYNSPSLKINKKNKLVNKNKLKVKEETVLEKPIVIAPLNEEKKTIPEIIPDKKPFDNLETVNLKKTQEEKNKSKTFIKETSKNPSPSNPKLNISDPNKVIKNERVAMLNKDDISYNLSWFQNITSETRKALKLYEPPQEKVQDVDDDNLRKETYETKKKSNHDGKIPENLLENWVPRYLSEKKTLTPVPENNDAQVELPKEQEPASEPEVMKLNDVNENIDDLELVGFLENNTAILKNTKKNKIEFIKKGQLVDGLKLLDIKSEEVTFGDEVSGKTLVKRLQVDN